jgi:NDP-sugar pyrophosphorylase family protein
MNKFFYNKIITRNQVIVLNKKHENVEAFRNYLSDRVLKLKPDEGTRNTIYLDYLTIIYKFCLSKLFSAEKISTLLSIGIYIFNESLEKKLPMMESYQLLKSFVDLHDS